MIGQALKGIIERLVALTNKCLSSYENSGAHDHSGDNFQSPAVPFNLRPNNIVNTGWSALSFFFLCSLLSWKAANLKATDDS